MDEVEMALLLGWVQPDSAGRRLCQNILVFLLHVRQFHSPAMVHGQPVNRGPKNADEAVAEPKIEY
jgi:hypothetical protein